MPDPPPDLPLDRSLPTATGLCVQAKPLRKPTRDTYAIPAPARKWRALEEQGNDEQRLDDAQRFRLEEVETYVRFAPEEECKRGGVPVVAREIGEVATEGEDGVQRAVEDDGVSTRVGGGSQADVVRSLPVDTSGPTGRGGFPQGLVRPLETGPVKYRVEVEDPVEVTLYQMIGQSTRR